MFEWISNFITESGYFGIALLMFVENIFPPIPSELIMPLAGFAAGQGKLNFFLAVIAGCAGSISGALFWYMVGYWFGLERLKRAAARHGRWLTVSPKEVDEAQGFFLRHCGKAVFLGRLVPAVRTLISVPAGIAGMGLWKFLIYSSLGTVIWTTALAGAGYFLGDRYEEVSHWLNPVSNIIVFGVVAWYLYRVITFRPKQASESRPGS
jgi:membrane protein DedA with SNARE-associated domain